ncbi:CYTH domain-containing protein [Paenibacillus septentrionalis]|uniref:CYTH domain-containing protein n=1 Tax=Paenibacillus septentrionalis TaxID=429342 RepID=A0ABW1V534_9BACL
MALEIERKYLLKVSPQQLIEEGTISLKSEQRIEQTYIAMDTDQELRVRRIQDLATGEYEYTHTFKNGVGLAREEVEYSITKVIYDQVVEAFGYIPLTKNRLTAAYGEMIVEIDIYDQVDFIVVEVEFSTMEEADSFVPPSWFGEEISFNKTYSNKAVWKQLQKQQ